MCGEPGTSAPMGFLSFRKPQNNDVTHFWFHENKLEVGCDQYFKVSWGLGIPVETCVKSPWGAADPSTKYKKTPWSPGSRVTLGIVSLYRRGINSVLKIQFLYIYSIPLQWCHWDLHNSVQQVSASPPRWISSHARKGNTCWGVRHLSPSWYNF